MEIVTQKPRDRKGDALMVVTISTLIPHAPFHLLPNQRLLSMAYGPDLAPAYFEHGLLKTHRCKN